MSDSTSQPSDAVAGIVEVVEIITDNANFEKYLGIDGTLDIIIKAMRDLHRASPRPQNPRLYLLTQLQLPFSKSSESEASPENRLEMLLNDNDGMLSRLSKLADSKTKVEDIVKKQFELCKSSMKRTREK